MAEKITIRKTIEKELTIKKNDDVPEGVIEVNPNNYQDLLDYLKGKHKAFY